MRQEGLADERVGRAHDRLDILRLGQRDALFGEHALKGDEMQGVGVDEGAVEVEQKSGFHERALPYIVAPICQGANSASP